MDPVLRRGGAISLGLHLVALLAMLLVIPHNAHRRSRIGYGGSRQNWRMIGVDPKRV